MGPEFAGPFYFSLKTRVDAEMGAKLNRKSGV